MADMLNSTGESVTKAEKISQSSKENVIIMERHATRNRIAG
jgi:hypothetical protein